MYIYIYIIYPRNPQNSLVSFHFYGQKIWKTWKYPISPISMVWKPPNRHGDMEEVPCSSHPFQCRNSRPSSVLRVWPATTGQSHQSRCQHLKPSLHQQHMGCFSGCFQPVPRNTMGWKNKKNNKKQKHKAVVDRCRGDPFRSPPCTNLLRLDNCVCVYTCVHIYIYMCICMYIQLYIYMQNMCIIYIYYIYMYRQYDTV